MSEGIHDAEMRYQQAVAALWTAFTEEIENAVANASDSQQRNALAHVSAIREQTEVQRQLLAVQERIARQMERRDVVEFFWCSIGDAEVMAADGALFLGTGRDGCILMGRPRTLPAEGVGDCD